MRSIRTKLVGYFAFIFILIWLIGLISNFLLAESYYIYKNRTIFEKNVAVIETMYRQQDSDLAYLLADLEHGYSMNTMISDENLHLIIHSKEGKTNKPIYKVPKEVRNFINQHKISLTEGPIYGMIGETAAEEPVVVYVKRLDDGNLLILRKALKGIEESASIANQFFILSGSLILCLGIVLIWFFSKKLTQPIISMSKTAEHIAQLHFDEKAYYVQQDELGNLGQNINKMAEMIKQNVTDLRNDVERRKGLIRNLSHELKTPISVIKGYAEGLQFGVAEDHEKRAAYLKVICEECDLMDHLVQELLSLSQLESGLAVVQMNKIQLQELIHSSLERFQLQLLHKQIEVRFVDEIGMTQMVYGDKNLIQRVIDNFISNAIRHVEGDNQIVISLEKTKIATRIAVFNTGQAIPVEEQTLIWDLFYKMNLARPRDYSGHGLGLSIVKMIADIHQAQVGVMNQRDGVEFYFDLPDSFHVNYTNVFYDENIEDRKDL